MRDGPTLGARPGILSRRVSPVLRALLRQRRRLLLAGVAIALSVGYLAGAFALLDRIGAGLDELASAAGDDADLVIEGEVAYESSLEQVRRLVPASITEQIAGVPGVETASHRLEDTAMLVDETGTPVVAPGLTEQPLGVNWPEDASIAPYEFSDGGPPGSAGEVAIDAGAADAAGLGVGDSVRVGGKAKFGEYEIVGIVEPSRGELPDGASLVVFTTDEARVVFDRPIDDNRISITVSEGADPDDVAAQIEPLLLPGVEIVDGATAAIHQQESLTRSFSLVRALVTGFAALALLVGMLTVANSLSLLHSQRRGLFANFRLVGASARQLRRAAFAEAGLLALASSAVGIPLGVLLAILIERALGALGTAVPTAGPILSVRAGVLAALLGIVATLMAAWRPVTRACRVPPVEAVRDVEATPTRGFNQVAVALSRAVIVAVAIAGVAFLAGASTTVVVAAAVCTGAFLLVLGALPWLLSRAVAGLLSVVPFRPAPLRRLASRDAARNPRRTAATTAAILLAAAVVAGLAVFLDSFTTSVDGAVDELVTADVVVDSETFTKGGLPADLVEQIGFVNGVDAASGWQVGRGTVGDVAVRMTALDGDSALDVVSPEWRDGPPDELTDATAWISASLADRTELGPGDPLPLLFHSQGYEAPVVAGVFTGGAALLGDVVVDRTTLVRQVPATVDVAALVQTDGSSESADAVSDLAATYGINSVLSPEEFIDSRAELLRGFERVVLWMLLFTLLQALVGVVNTLILSVGERRREFGLLRVSGASRKQVLRMVLFEGFSLATVGTTLGIAVGLGLAGGAVWGLSSLGLGVFAVPVPTLIGIAIAAVAIGIAAAWIPARVAASVPPLEAILDSGVEFAPSRRAAVAAGAPEPAVPTYADATTPAGAAPPAPALARSVDLGPARVGSADGAPVVVGTADPAMSAIASALLEAPMVAAEGTASVAPGSAEADALFALYGFDGSVGVPEPEPVREVLEVLDVPEVLEVEEIDDDEAVLGVADDDVPEVVDVEPVDDDELAEAIIAVQTPTPFGVRDPEPQPASQEPLVPEPVVPEQPAAAAPGPVVEETAQEPASEPVVPGRSDPEVPAASDPEPAAARRRGRKGRSGPRVPRRRSRGAVAPTTSAADGWVAPIAGDPRREDPTTPPDGVDHRAPAAPAGARGPADPRPSGTPGPVSAPGSARTDSFEMLTGALDRASVLASADALAILGGALAPGERVEGVVCGRVREWPTALARTDRRLLVVVDRPGGRPVVESLPPEATQVVVRPATGMGGAGSVMLMERGRALEISGIVDLDAAETLVLRRAITP